MSERFRPTVRWRSRCCRLLGWIAGLSLLAFLLLQVLLASSWASKKAEDVLSARIGLPVEIEKLGWTPWGGAQLEGLLIQQPEPLKARLDEPLLKLERIRVWPDYLALLRGKPGLDGLEIESPRLCVSFEMLAVLGGSGAVAAEPPAVVAAAESVEPPPIVQGPAVASGSEPVPAVTPKGGEGGAIETNAYSEVEPVWIVARSASIRVVSAVLSDPLLDLEDLDIDLPLFGRLEEGALRVGRMCLAGGEAETNVSGFARGQGLTLEMAIPENAEKSSAMAGVMQLGVMPGLPFRFSANFRIKGLEKFLAVDAVEVSSAELVAVSHLAGWITAPATWSGSLGLEGRGIDLGYPGGSSSFGRLGAVATLGQGVLKSNDVRLIGEDLALLGNGWISRGGGLWVMRLVVADDSVVMIEQSLRNTVGNARFDWRSLAPGDRKFVDLKIWSEAGTWYLGLGEEGSVLPLNVLRALSAFRSVVPEAVE